MDNLSATHITPHGGSSSQHTINSDDLENATKAVYVMVILPLSLFFNFSLVRAYQLRHEPWSAYIRFIINLIITSIVPTLTLLPLIFAVQFTHGSWTLGIDACRFSTFILHTSTNVVFLLLCIMHMDRYIAYSFANEYHLRMLPARAVFLNVVCWLISAAFSAPLVAPELNWTTVDGRLCDKYANSTNASVTINSTHNSNCRLICVPWPKHRGNYLSYAIAKILMLYVAALGLAIFCQVKIVRRSKKIIKTLQARGHRNSISVRRPSSRTKLESATTVTRTFSVLVGIESTFLIFCLPMLVISVIGDWLPFSRGIDSIDSFFVLLNSTFYAVAPLSIFARDRLMRRIFRRMYKCLFDQMDYNKNVKWHRDYHNHHHGGHGVGHHHHQPHHHASSSARTVPQLTVSPDFELKPNVIDYNPGAPARFEIGGDPGNEADSEDSALPCASVGPGTEITTALSTQLETSERSNISTVPSMKPSEAFEKGKRMGMSIFRGKVRKTPMLYANSRGVKLQLDSANIITAEGWNSSQALSSRYAVDEATIPEEPDSPSQV